MRSLWLFNMKGPVLVDDEDFESLNRHEWHLASRRYAARRVRRDDGKTVTLYMHRAILGAPINKHVDHINGDGLDNRRQNLRLADRSHNQANRGKPKSNTSGYKGVGRRRGRWWAYIKVDNKMRYLGMFDVPEDAARAYDKAAREIFGEFAFQNFPL